MFGIHTLDVGVFLVVATAAPLVIWTCGALRGPGIVLHRIVLVYSGVFALGVAMLVHCTRVLHG